MGNVDNADKTLSTELEPPPASVPAWANQLGEVCQALAGELGAGDRDRLREMAWCLLDTALLRLVRSHARQLGRVDPAEVEDIAAEKSLDLLSRAESGHWDTRNRTGVEIVAFLSKVARNGLVDRLRLRSRVVPLGDGFAVVADRAAASSGQAVLDDPSRMHDASRYAAQLEQCVSKLSPRTRTLWFLRVLLEWPSQRIATHPAVNLKPTHVDVELGRAREQVRLCMLRSGFEISPIPPGVFTVLWSGAFSDALAAVAEGEEESL